jgi:hypothetical protein
MAAGTLILLSLCVSGWSNWKTIKTDDFTVMYKPGYSWEAHQSLKTLEFYRASVIDLTGNDTRSVPVVIEDVGTMSNAYADPFFYNIHFFTYPHTFGYALEGGESWYRSALVHEYIHIAHLTRTAGLSRMLTAIFGAPFQPNMYAPGWVIEGITVYGESKPSPYEGRMNDGYFDSYIAARIRDGNFPSIVEATNIPAAVPLDGIYVYGGSLFDFLATRYGEERFKRFFNLYGSFFWAPVSALVPSLGFDIAARKVYGKSFPSLFTEWKEYEELRFADWLTEGSRITKKGWYLSPMVTNGNRFYYTRSKLVKPDAFSPRSVIQIMEFDPRTGEERVISNLTSSVSAPMKIHDQSLYYAQLEFKKGMENVFLGGFGATSTLHRRNLLSGDDDPLFTDDIRAFCVLLDGSILYAKDRVHASGSDLWHFDGENHEKLMELDYLIAELEADGERIVVTAAKEYENPDIYLYDPSTGDLTTLLSTPWVEGYLHLIDEKRLLFTANFDGEHALYELNIAEHHVYQLTGGGFAQSGAIIGNTLYYIGLNSSGNDIYKKEYVPYDYELSDWQPSSKPDLLLADSQARTGGYGDVLKTFFPAVRVPIVFAEYEEQTRWYLGTLLAGGDATGEHYYYTFFAHDPHETYPVVDVMVESQFFSPVSASFSYSSGGSVYAGLYYQFLARLAPGVRHASLYSDFYSFDDYQRREVSPGFSFSFNYPFTTIAFGAWFPLERKTWHSSIDRNAQFAAMSIRQSIKDGRFSLSSLIASNVQDPDTMSLPLRGYKEVPATRALFASTEYTHKLFSVRKGFWDVNSYLEDVFATVFLDYGLNHEHASFISAGCEIKAETKMAFGYLQFVQKVGVAVNGEKELSVYYGIASAIENPYAKRELKNHSVKDRMQYRLTNRM